MKKFLLFLTLLISAIGLTHAAETLTFDFSVNKNTHEWPNKQSADNAKQYTSAVDSKFKITFDANTWWYKNSSNSYIAFAKTAGATIEIAPYEGKIVTAIEITWGSTNKSKFDLFINSSTTATGQFSFSSNATTSKIEIPTESQSVDNTFRIVTANTGNQCGIKKIVYTVIDAGTGGGEVSKDCGISFSSDSENVDYPGTDYTLPFNNENNVTVTFSSSDAKVATVANESNKPKLTINGCGTTTITASFAGDANYNAKEVSLKLTVDQGTPALSFAETSYSANLGEAFALPELSGVPDGAIISWTSTATDVAEFIDGALTIKAEGSTTIKATTSATDLYKEGNASFTLNVVDPNSPVYTVNYSDFTAKTDLGAETVGDIRFVFSKGTSTQYTPQNNGSHLKFYSGNTMDITAPDGFVIDKIEFNCTSAEYAAADRIESASENGTTTTPTNGTVATWSLKDDATATQTVSIKNASNSQARIKSIVIYCSKYSSKEPAGLAYSPAEVTLVEGDELAEQPTLNNPNKLTVTYSSGNTDVATVDAKTGVISLAGGLGTAVITASTEGDANHKAGSATFTITVKPIQVAYLVTDASTLKKGDIIIIANQDEAMAISNEETTDYRAATAITFNSDKSEIHSISNDVMLFKLGVWTDKGKSYWMLATTNYTGKAGSLYCGSSSSSSLEIGTPSSDYYDAVITIDQETGKAKIAFNKGAESGANIVRYDSTSDLFNCYTASNSQEPVYIYKVVDKPATVNVNTELSKINFVEKVNASDNNVINLTANFSTSSSYNKVAIYMEDVLVGIYDVTDAKVNASFDHVPYLPNAEFTMRPVLADIEGNPTQFGPSEALSLTWPNINSYGAVELDNTLVWIGSDADPLPEKATLGAISYFDLDIPTGSFLYYYVDVVAKNQSSGVAYNGEFAWCEGGFSYAVNPYLENVPVDTDRTPDLSKIETFPTIEFSITPIYKFDVAEKYRSLVPAAATPRPARVASSTITDGVQTVVCDAKPAESKFYATSKVSGVEGVTVDANAPVEFFNLQGVRVDGALAPGIYIRRQGQAVSKVRIN